MLGVKISGHDKLKDVYKAAFTLHFEISFKTIQDHKQREQLLLLI